MFHAQVALVERRIFLVVRDLLVSSRVVVITVGAEEIGAVNLERPLL